MTTFMDDDDDNISSVEADEAEYNEIMANLTPEQRALAEDPGAYVNAMELINQTLTDNCKRDNVSAADMNDVLLDLRNYIEELHTGAINAIQLWMRAVNKEQP